MWRALPVGERAEVIGADFRTNRLEIAWERRGIQDFDPNPSVRGFGDYLDDLRTEGRDGVLAVIRELLAERAKAKRGA